MNQKTLIEVVEKLIGSIYPIGDSNHDEGTYKNLQNAIALVNHLTVNIDYVAYGYKDRREGSISRSGVTAEKFIQSLADWKDK